jgi:hypothetical protein
MTRDLAGSRRAAVRALVRARQARSRSLLLQAERADGLGLVGLRRGDARSVVVLLDTSTSCATASVWLGREFGEQRERGGRRERPMDESDRVIKRQQYQTAPNNKPPTEYDTLYA